MGGKGPRPSPTKLKILRGEKRKDRIETGEPEPPSGVPVCPAGLTKVGREEFARIVDDLRVMDLLSSAYRPSLAAYCAAYARWLSAELRLKHDGLYQRTKDGRLTTHPAVAIARDASDSMRRWLMEFGLTPSAVTRVKPIGDGKKDKKKGIGQFLA